MKIKMIIPLLLIIYTLNLFTYERPYISYAFDSTHSIQDLPLIIAHKSKFQDLPPNTLEGIQAFLATDIKGLEMDIQITRDGIPVLFHDDLLEENTTGRGSVKNLTAAELKKIYYKGTNLSIPTLEEVFKLTDKQKYLFLDVKNIQLYHPEMAKAIAHLIKKHDLYDRVVVETFNPLFLLCMRVVDPEIMVQLDFVEEATPTLEESPEQLESIPETLKKPYIHWMLRNLLMPDLLGPRFSNDKNTLKLLAEHGYPLIAWTVDDADQAYELFKAGVIGIQTNRPLELMEEIKLLIPETIMDAGREISEVAQVIEVQNMADIQRALEIAQNEKKKVSIAGAQHTMGGHTFNKDNIVLKMHRFNKMRYVEDSQTVVVESGATWREVQEFLDPLNRALIVMQSDNIFSVGGSLSANVHGWQTNKPPIISTVRQFRLMLASGEILTCSRDENPELFKAVIGGYGLFGVILDVELDTTPNVMLQYQSTYANVSDFPTLFERDQKDLAFGRFSISRKKLLEEVSVNTFKKVNLPLEPLKKEKLVGLKRNIFRLSERSDLGKDFRWFMEKMNSHYLQGRYISRNNAMHVDIHVLWPQISHHKDTLQEYFVPKEQYASFINHLRDKVEKYPVNLLNVTVREVLQDSESYLAFAKNDSYSFVLLFSEGEEDKDMMKAFTQELIDEVLSLNGSFYLPYRLNFRLDQFHKAYPRFSEFMELKREVDPELRFTSRFWDYISS